jgi:hypothetical protein
LHLPAFVGTAAALFCTSQTEWNGSSAVLHLSALCWNGSGAVLHLSALCLNGSGTKLYLPALWNSTCSVLLLFRALNAAKLSDWVDDWGDDWGVACTPMQDSNGLDYAALERNVQKETLTEGERENNREFSSSNKWGGHFSLHVGPMLGAGTEVTAGEGEAKEKEYARHDVVVRLISTCAFERYL